MSFITYVEATPGAVGQVLVWTDPRRRSNCDACGIAQCETDVVSMVFSYKAIESPTLTGDMDLRGLQVALSFSSDDCTSETAVFDLVNGVTIVVPASQIQARIIYPVSALYAQPNLRIFGIVGRGNSRQAGPSTQPRCTVELGSVSAGANSSINTIPKFAESVFIEADTSSLGGAVVTQYLGAGGTPIIISQGLAGRFANDAMPVASGASSFIANNGAVSATKLRAVFRLTGV